eukprot:TRINITY_DN7546_c0_g1_i3.p1 TRINITY_DN7546_c0_g1~~TRINITY_DN7546_c0_g1_i3.p1  ORF type:complete len:327 (+),score=83.13 TRINITY_DN7546_c0_g1_i3:2-982(+)
MADDTTYRFSGKRAAKETSNADEAAYYERKPKAPCSAYAFFMSENRSRVANENPRLASKDIVRMVAAEWRSAIPELKQKYQAKADQDRVRHDQEYAVWIASKPASLDTSTIAKRAKKSSRQAARAKVYAEDDDDDDDFEDVPRRSTRSRPPKTDVQTSQIAVHHQDTLPAKQDVFQTATASGASNSNDQANLPVKVFTDEFVNYHHSRERLLRAFKAESLDLAKENEETHKKVQDLKALLVKLEAQAGKLKASNDSLGLHLGTIIGALQQSFVGVKLPSVSNTGDVDAFLASLAHIVTYSPEQTKMQIRHILTQALRNDDNVVSAR